MFKVKRKERKFSFLKGSVTSVIWEVIEIRFDGTEDSYGFFGTKAKADLVAQLLNETATLAVA